MAASKSAPTQLHRQLIRFALDVVFPPVCARCRRAGYLLCDSCRATLIRIVEPICSCCGRRLEQRDAGGPESECRTCRQDTPPLTQMRAALLYEEPTSSLIHLFKYDGYFSLGAPFADLMNESWPDWVVPPDLILPIPLHKRRQRRRGYNQSALLARPLAAARGLEYNDTILSRVRHTVPQVGLSPEERALNVHEAFDATHAARSRHVLLIDDVLTTGATMRSAAEILLSYGASSVAAYCLARVS